MRTAFFATAAAGLAALAISASAWAGPQNVFQVNTRVVDSEGPGPAAVDPDLVNPWGISQAPQGALWISDNHTSKSTLYDRKTYGKLGLIVNIPGPGGGGGSPTGTVFSPFAGSGAFDGSVFLFVTEEGSIVGWKGSDGTQAVTEIDNSVQGSSYRGVAVATQGGQPRLYAADFARGVVEMYDAGFTHLGDFTDPSLPAGYGPFDVQALGGQIYVSFAKRQPGGDDEQVGAHLGYVDVFDTAGHLVKQLVAKGALNAPWGMMIAPKGFGDFGGDLLVGNFGDGRINVYDPESGAHLGTLKDSGGDPIEIEGLWGLAPGAHATVVFTAGPGDEEHGALGSIEFAGATP